MYSVIFGNIEMTKKVISPARERVLETRSPLCQSRFLSCNQVMLIKQQKQHAMIFELMTYERNVSSDETFLLQKEKDTFRLFLSRCSFTTRL